MHTAPSSQEQDPFGRLRWLLAQSPSPMGFAQVMDVFASWRDDETLAMGLAYAREHMKDWDDASRYAKLSRCWPSFPHEEAPPQFALVRRLDMSGWGGDASSVSSLTDTPDALHLTGLYAARCEFAEELVGALAQAPHMANLRILDLSNNGLPDAGIHPLIESHAITQLTDLRLGDNELIDWGVQAIANASNMRRLRQLDLSRNQNGDWGVQAIARSPHMAQLEALYLAENMSRDYLLISDDAARAIAKSPYMANLDTLDLSGNHITKAGLKALAHSPHLSASVRYHFRKALGEGS